MAQGIVAVALGSAASHVVLPTTVKAEARLIAGFSWSSIMPCTIALTHCAGIMLVALTSTVAYCRGVELPEPEVPSATGTSF